MDSVTEPIWLTFSSRQLQAFLSTACWILFGLVTVKSSPTIWLEQKNRRVTIVTLYSRYWRFSLSSSRKNQLVYLRFHKANKRLGMPMIVAKRKKKRRNRMTVRLCHMSACLCAPHLDVYRRSEFSPLLPVILVKWVLNGLDWRKRDTEEKVSTVEMPQTPNRRNDATVLNSYMNSIGNVHTAQIFVVLQIISWTSHIFKWKKEI